MLGRDSLYSIGYDAADEMESMMDICDSNPKMTDNTSVDSEKKEIDDRERYLDSICPIDRSQLPIRLGPGLFKPLVVKPGFHTAETWQLETILKRQAEEREKVERMRQLQAEHHAALPRRKLKTKR